MMPPKQVKKLPWQIKQLVEWKFSKKVKSLLKSSLSRPNNITPKVGS